MFEGFEYGNTRLRARKSQLFDAAALHGLAGRTLDELFAALAKTPYAPDLADAVPRAAGIRRLYEALRMHLGRSLRSMQRFYAGDAREAVELLVERWDLANLRTLVRAKARGAGADEVAPLLVPAGHIEAVALIELARQPDLRATLDSMVEWGAPLRAIALRLLGSFRAYETSRDPAVLERELERAWAERQQQAMARGVGGRELARLLRAEIDQHNLLAMLRLWSAMQRGERARERSMGEHFVGGGTLAQRTLDAALAQPGRAEVVATLLAHADRRREPLARWVEDGDSSALAERLERELTSWAIRRFVEGDPLSIAVPIAFTFAKENEVRNLRLLGAAAARGIAASRVREQLWLT